MKPIKNFDLSMLTEEDLYSTLLYGICPMILLTLDIIAVLIPLPYTVSLLHTYKWFGTELFSHAELMLTKPPQKSLLLYVSLKKYTYDLSVAEVV